MRLGKGPVALVVALAFSVVLAVLLSPIGFERRPTADLTVVGYISIAAVAAGIALDLVAIVLTLRRAGLGSVLAIAGSVAFLIPNVTDKLGAFFSLPASPVISALEYAHLVALLATLLLAWSVLRERQTAAAESRRSSSAKPSTSR